MEVVFSQQALQELTNWHKHNKKIYFKILNLITSIQADLFSGIGKPEALKHDLQGFWSRRITQEHRLVYEVRDDTIFVSSCKYHY